MGKKKFTNTKFHSQSVGLLDRIKEREGKVRRKMGEKPISKGLLEIAALFLKLLPMLEPLLALCPGKKPPEPGPVPPALEALGITTETWKQANGAKFAAQQSRKNPSDNDDDDEHDDEFSKRAIRRAAKEIRQADGSSMKEAKVTAISAMQSGCDETVEDIAISMQDAKANKSALLS